MKGSILLVSFLLSFNLYADFICDMAEGGVDVAVEVVSTSLKCKNEEVVRDDLSALINLERLCSKELEKDISSPVMCAVIAKTTARFLVTKIPQSWECDEKVSVKHFDKMIYNTCITVTRTQIL